MMVRIAMLAAGATLVCGAASVAEPAAPQRSLALVITDLRHGFYESDEAKEECPSGFNAAENLNYDQQFATTEDREAYQARFGRGPGNRGPLGENVFYSPLSVEDPIPFKLSQESQSPGLNLDGKVGPNDMMSPEGLAGIDNQLARVIACVEGFRTKGVIEEFVPKWVRQHVHNRYVIEIDGIDSLQNDPEVTIRTYRGLDPILISAADVPVAGGTQRIDYRYSRRYMVQTGGRILNGVLTTDPVDINLPLRNNDVITADIAIRDARFELSLRPDGADGLLGGYSDVDSWFMWLSRCWGAGTIAAASKWSPPSLYRALLDHADAHPDRKTGRRTAISTAFKVKFVQVFIPTEGGPAPDAPVRSAAL